MIRVRSALACGALFLAVAHGAAGAAPALEPIDRTVCRLIDSAAQANHLPVGFMTRVIWRESSFRAAVISPQGAEGIAQFMPATASARGLHDPFDPQQAIPQAARLLSDLRARFGNLGLAAAAYNAGPARVADWLRGTGMLPAETRTYVRFVTRRSAETWISSGSTAPEGTALEPAPPTQSCLAVTAELRRIGAAAGEVAEEGTPLAPWGVQLAGNFSKALALAEFRRAERRYAAVLDERRPMIIGRRLRYLGTRPYYQVRLPAATRRAADALCGRIRGVGGACVAVRS